jgi:Fe-S-cluster-containing dehydrogenase component
MHKAFVLDINKCTGCQACEVACAVENQLEPGTSWRAVETFNAPRFPGIPLFHLSLACNHCVDAPCMEHCPALAYSKDDATGAVTVDAQACIGCKYCTWACPYDAPRFDPAEGIVTKCTFCNHRLAEGKRPACVSECPTGALQTADLDTAPGVADVPGMPRADVGPAVRFIPLRGERPFPEVASDETFAPPGSVARPGSKISLRSEWPLAVFTLLAAALVGLMAAGASPHPIAFVALAAAGMGLSALHLGKKARAWRAILNWRRSWLSREIILFSAFACLSAVRLFAGGERPALTWLIAVTGFAALFAMDRVYEVTRAPGLRVHSAQVLLTGALVLGFALWSGPLFLSVMVVKLILYLGRKVARPRGGALVVVLSAIRVVPGVLVPVWLWVSCAAPATCGMAWVFGIPLAFGMALGEIIDRCEFYLELDVPTPRGQMAADLESALVGES